MKAIFIVPSDYDSLAQKGVIDIIRQRDEKRFLENVWTIHPFALHDRDIDICPGHVLIERRQPSSHRYRAISWLSYLCYIATTAALVRRLVKRHKIDLVRSQDPYFCGLIGYLATRMSGAKFCVSLHADYDKMNALDPIRGAPRIFGSRRLAVLLERFVLSKADRVLAISDYMARYGVRHGAQPRQVRLFRHRIAASVSRSGAVFPSSRGESLALVSRLSRQKHILDLLALASALASLRSHFCIEVAGDGPERQQIEDELRARGLSNHVRLLGFQSADQVGALLSRARASFVFIGGASLVESAAAACPVIAYNCEWHPEVVEDGVTGFLVGENDTTAAAQAAAKLLDDPALARRMGVALRDRVASIYDDERLVEQRRAVYRELVRQGNAKLG